MLKGDAKVQQVFI